jgi:ABC-type transporter Mla maintaining outer membrane lipid asymmetry permease subunit MlaE
MRTVSKLTQTIFNILARTKNGRVNIDDATDQIRHLVRVTIVIVCIVGLVVGIMIGYLVF